MALPPANSVKPYAVYYDDGNINYSDGVNWYPILTAGSFTQVTANGYTTPLDLGTWAGLILDNQTQIASLQNSVTNLSLQVANLQATVTTLNTSLEAAQANIIQNILSFIQSNQNS